MGGKAYSRQLVIPSATLGLNGVALNATQTSNSFSLAGYNQLTLHLDHSNSSATEIQWYIETTNDAQTTWGRRTTSSVSGGNETVSEHTVKRTVAADEIWTWHCAINKTGLGRLVFTSTGGDANDTIDVELTLGVSA